MAGLNTVANKWVLITGAASGIGLGTALAFARHGANLILTDINPVQLDDAAAKVLALGAKCLHKSCDVSSAASVDECVRWLQSEGIVPAVLINNAGVAFLGGFLETPVLQWQRILDINVLGLVHMIHAFLPAMLEAREPSCIVNIASAAAYLPAPNMSAYAASKGAVMQLNEVLAMELAGSKVSTLCVYPGVINTPIVSAATRVGKNISAAQLKTLQRYYVEYGCLPDVVGEDILRAVLSGKDHLFTGPMSRLGRIVTRLSSALARRVSLTAARTNGYLPRHV